MNELIKLIIELIAITFIWIAIDYKGEKTFKPKNKEWWVQFILLFLAIVMMKIIYKN